MIFKAVITLLLFVVSFQEKHVPSLKDIEDFNDPILKEIFQTFPKSSTHNYKDQDLTINSNRYNNNQQFNKNHEKFNQQFSMLSNTNQGQVPKFQNRNDQDSYQNIVITPNSMTMLANDGYNAFINGARQLTNVIPNTLSDGPFMLLG